MTEEEQFIYDLLISEAEQTESEEEFMRELLEEEFETEYDEQEIDREYERIGREFDEHAEEDREIAAELESEYELDPYFSDDGWLDAGEEWELSPDYEES